MSEARLGVAGVDRPALAKLAVAGINTRPLRQAALGVAGNWSPALRPEVLRQPGRIHADRLGDQAALHGWERGVLFCAYTYLACPEGPGHMRWRPAFQTGFGPGERMIPLWLDSNAYARWTGQAPRWDTIERLCQTADLVRPDGMMAYDTYGDAAASLLGWEDMRAAGYPDTTPVWQMREAWDPRAADAIRDPWGVLDDATRCAIANARLAARDPVLQYMCSQSHLVAIGGLVQGPCPRQARGPYIQELCWLFPDNQFWPLGQASEVVVNYLGQHGLLQRVWTDGSWWIHNARCERFAIVRDGLLRSIYLEGNGRSLFTLAEMMAANVRALLGAYGNLWTWPQPAPLPVDLTDAEAVAELRRRMAGVQSTLLPMLPQTGGLYGLAGDEEDGEAS